MKTLVSALAAITVLVSAGLPGRAQTIDDGEEEWFSLDIGNVGAAGSASYVEPGLFTLRASGIDIYGKADGFHFLYLPVSGDAEIVGRVLSLQNTNIWAKAGLMVRETLDANAVNMMLNVTPGSGINLQRRLTAGADTVNTKAYATGAAPYWLKLRRSGTLFNTWRSADGVLWTFSGSVQAPMSFDVEFGLAVTSHNNSALTTATFDNVRLTPLPAGHGLLGHYFTGIDFAQLSVTRTDGAISFNWGLGKPDAAMPKDDFSIRWTGEVVPRYTELYTFSTVSDDGVRLWVNGQLLVDNWSGHQAVENRGSVFLYAGQHYDVLLEYFDISKHAVIELYWSSQSEPKQIIPWERLYLPAEAPGPPADGGSQLPQFVVLNGSEASGTLGDWTIVDSSLLANDRRGWIEYTITVPADNVYRLGIEGGPRFATTTESYRLKVSVDGAPLGAYELLAISGAPGIVRPFTPWLSAGTHVVRIVWDNYDANAPRLQVSRVWLEAAAGADANENGIVDWVETRLGIENSIDVVPVGSLTSPACLEGKVKYFELMTINPATPLRRGLGERWYADVALDPDAPVEVEMTFENGSVSDAATLEWKPANVLAAEPGTEVFIRKGDALRLAAWPAGTEPDASATVSLAIDGQPLEETTAAAPLVHRFENAGLYVVNATHTLAGTATTGTMNVRVVEASFGPALDIYAGHSRTWESAGIPAGIPVEADPRITWQETTAAGVIPRKFSVNATEIGSLPVIARLFAGGPILAGGSVDVLGVWNTDETGDTQVIFTYANGDELVQTSIVAENLPPGAYVRLEIFVAGVMFEDGTRVKILTAADFNAVGVATVSFIRPANVTTSICHRLYVHAADGTLIGQR